MWIDRNNVLGSVGNEIPSTITAILTLGYTNGHSIVILQSESAWPEVHPHVATSIRATLLFRHRQSSLLLCPLLKSWPCGCVVSINRPTSSFKHTLTLLSHPAVRLSRFRTRSSSVTPNSCSMGNKNDVIPSHHIERSLHEQRTEPLRYCSKRAIRQGSPRTNFHFIGQLYCETI